MSEYEFYISRLREFKQKMEMDNDIRLWKNLIVEEREELLKELVDFVYVSAGAASIPFTYYHSFSGEEVKKERGLSEAAKDAIDFGRKAYGPENFAMAFERVHQSNLSKLGDDGKPIRREDGKITKGPNYEPPYLKDLI